MGTERMRVEMMLITEQFGDIVARVSVHCTRVGAVKRVVAFHEVCFQR